jgi:hypothetical protein
MPVEFTGLLEDVDGYEGKNGFGANITVSSKNAEKKVKRLEFRTNSKEMAEKLEKKLGTNVKIKVILQQNNFGLRFGDILEVA